MAVGMRPCGRHRSHHHRQFGAHPHINPHTAASTYTDRYGHSFSGILPGALTAEICWVAGRLTEAYDGEVYTKLAVENAQVPDAFCALQSEVSRLRQ